MSDFAKRFDFAKPGDSVIKPVTISPRTSLTPTVPETSSPPSTPDKYEFLSYEDLVNNISNAVTCFLRLNSDEAIFSSVDKGVSAEEFHKLVATHALVGSTRAVAEVTNFFPSYFTSGDESYHISYYMLHDGDTVTVFIRELSCGDPHSAGVRFLGGQFEIWRSLSEDLSDMVTSTSDGTRQFGDVSMAPDLKITQLNIGAAKLSYPRVIIEVEVSHRSCPDMRRDFMQYFSSDANRDLLMVIGMKVYMKDNFEESSAAVVVWERIGEEILTTKGLDIGFVELSAQARAPWHQHMGPNDLPPVPADLWMRRSPLLPDTSTTQGSAIYRQWYQVVGRPIVSIPFAVVTHNMGWTGDALRDFDVDFGRVFFEMYKQM